MKKTVAILLFLSLRAFAQHAAFRIDSLPKQGILLDKGWKWHAGDNADFAKADFDDSAWESIDPTKPIKELKQIDTNKPLWLRIKLENQANYKNLLLSVKQSGATEIFIHGKLVKHFGKIDDKTNHSIAFDPLNESFILGLDTAQNTLAVRYFFQKGIEYNTLPSLTLPLFSASLSDDSKYALVVSTYYWNGFNIAVALMLFLIHFIYFLSYTPLKTNLWFSLSALCWIVGDFILHQKDITHSIDFKITYSHYHFIIDQLRAILLLITMFLFLKQTQKWLLISFVSVAFFSGITNFFFYFESIWILNFCFVLMYGTFIIYMGYNAQKRSVVGGKYVIFGVIGYVIFWGLFVLSFTFNWSILSKDIFFHIAILIIPTTMSSLLGLNFKNANKQIIRNLEQINSLSIEKQQILSTQNETLEKQVEVRTAELTQKNRILEIESALERVRGQSMAMHHSDNLREVIATVTQQLVALGLSLDHARFAKIWEDGSGGEMWISMVTNPFPYQIIVPTFDSVIVKDALAIRADTEFFAKTYSYEEKNSFYRFFFENTIAKNTPQDRINYVMNAKGFTTSAFRTKDLWIAMAKLDIIPFTEEENAIFKRFAQVFDQAYIRFLDLQRAEEQAEQARLNLIQIQTEKKRAEDALSELKSTQNQLIQKEKLASLGELTAGIAHEIQNPLNFVNNFSEMSVELAQELKGEAEKPEIDKELIIDLANDLSQNQAKINHHGKRAASIVSGMLEHSRTSTGERTLTDLNKLADEYLRLSYHGMRAKDNSFSADYELIADGNLPKINIVPQDMGRVLLNLINNAFWAVRTVAKPKVIISTLNDSIASSDGIVIKIRDNGTGIPPDVLPKIFQPFFTTKPTGEGTGLGLSLAYDIVTKGHGGTIEVESVEGEGTTFVVKLPIQTA